MRSGNSGQIRNFQPELQILIPAEHIFLEFRPKLQIYFSRDLKEFSTKIFLGTQKGIDKHKYIKLCNIFLISTPFMQHYEVNLVIFCSLCKFKIIVPVITVIH